MANSKENNISAKYDLGNEELTAALNDMQKLIPPDRSLFLLDKEPTATDTDNLEEDKIYRHENTIYIKVNNVILKFSGTPL